MREPITKLAIVPISSMDSSIVKQLAPSLREFSINGGGNESPIIFFVARVVAKGEKNASERRILLVTLKHVILYDEQGRQVHAVHIVDLARVIVCQDGFTVLKVPREHDMAIKLDQSLYLEYFLNILKVLHLHFTIGSPIANDVPIDRRRPIDATSPAAGLLVQGSSTPCDQLTGGNKLNLTRNPNAQYVDHVTIPGILNVDTSKQDFLSLLLHIPPPPKRPAADAPLVTLSAQDMAKANAVLQHPLFRPVMEARAQQQQQQQQHSASLTAPPSITSMQFDSTAPPSPMTRSVHTQPPPVPSHPVVEATPARVHNVTVRSIATIERDDDSPVISPRVEDRLIGGPTGWLKAAEPTPPAGVAPMPPPPPPPLSTSLGSSPLQKLMQVTPLPSVQAKQHASPITASTPSLLHDRVEGFMKLYMPQHLHLVERIASDYRGREEECLKMLFARLEHEQQRSAVPRKSSIFDDQSDVEVEAPYDAPRAHQPSHTTDDRQRQQQSFNNTSDFDSTGAILQRLQRLEEENRQLRDAVRNKQFSSIERQTYPSSSSHGVPRHYDAHHGQFQNTHESLHPHKQSKTLQRDAAYDRRDYEDHRQWDRHHARPEATVRPDPFARESQSRGSMEEFEASIGGRLPRDRVVLRQHRLDELRKDVHLLMSSDDSHSTRRGSGMQSVVRIGLLQDEIVATSAKQQLDVALTEEEDRDSGFSATRESLHPHSRPSMPMSGLSSRTPSEFTFPTQRSQGLDAFPKQSSHYAPNVAAATAAASAPSQSHGAGNATDDAGYAQWYYSEYVPRLMFQQRKAQQQQGKRGQ